MAKHWFGHLKCHTLQTSTYKSQRT
uniref:Uncharacterized protein n=1 Tax=Rhizophora mucronata TaxID=61149 RepID=A0A2P2NEW5_RHIMU